MFYCGISICIPFSSFQTFFLLNTERDQRKHMRVQNMKMCVFFFRMMNSNLNKNAYTFFCLTNTTSLA